jgi:peptidyl-prolyl cis-trans isomerase A (cyclophilin A)
MMSLNTFFLVALFTIYVSLAVGKTCEINGNIPNPSPQPDPKSPESFTISFYTNVVINGVDAEPIVIEVNRSWAPLGSDRLYSLMQDGYYNGAAFFRVVPDFVLQFGISADPAESSKWNTNIADDPVLVSNTNWTVTYATGGPDTRTTQLFINYIDNSRLDESGFAPFGRVVSGFETALQVVNPTPDDSDGCSQGKYMKLGNEWILREYPDISMITCGILSE